MCVWHGDNTTQRNIPFVRCLTFIVEVSVLSNQVTSIIEKKAFLFEESV
jgi:hypothetical protein